MDQGDGYYDRRIRIANKSAHPDDYLRITEQYFEPLHPDFTLVKPFKGRLEAGELDTAFIRFTPSSNLKVTDLRFIIRTNDPNRPQATFYCAGQGIGTEPALHPKILLDSAYKYRYFGDWLLDSPLSGGQE
jgi:hypothetical protein